MSKATRGRCELPGAAQDAGEVALVALQPVGAVGRVVIAPPALVALLGQIAQMVPAAAAADLVAVRGFPGWTRCGPARRTCATTVAAARQTRSEHHDLLLQLGLLAGCEDASPI